MKWRAVVFNLPRSVSGVDSWVLEERVSGPETEQRALRLYKKANPGVPVSVQSSYPCTEGGNTL